MGKTNRFDIVLPVNRIVYYYGELLTGKCILNLKKDKRMRVVRVSMHGVAKVYWCDGENASDHHRSKEDFFFKQQVLFGRDNLDSECTLAKGMHEFSFSFELSQKSISTFFEGQFGSIRYWLEAEIVQPWAIVEPRAIVQPRALNRKVKKAFKVVRAIDINNRKYSMHIAKNIERTLCCCSCTTGPVSINARTDRSGYCSGESIAISAKFTNLCSSNATPYAKLYQVHMFLANGYSKIIRNKLAEFTGGIPISPTSSGNWNAEVLLIPANVPPSITDCLIIYQEYYVKVALCIQGIYKVSLTLPIVIGTVPRHPPVISPHYPVQPQIRQIEQPPRYSECINDAMDTKDKDDGQLGKHKVTPMYTYGIASDNMHDGRPLEGGARNLYDVKESYAEVHRRTVSGGQKVSQPSKAILNNAATLWPAQPSRVIHF